MNTVKLSETLTVSRISLGFWRLLSWKKSNKELSEFIREVVDLGITTFDNADIYGDYECEEVLGEVLYENRSMRHSLQIVTKCGILIKSNEDVDNSKIVGIMIHLKNIL